MKVKLFGIVKVKSRRGQIVGYLEIKESESKCNEKAVVGAIAKKGKWNKL